MSVPAQETMGNVNPFSGSAKPIDESDIVAFEQGMGVTLPEPLRALYLARNGGSPERTYFRSEDGSEYRLRGVRPIRHPRFDGDILLETTVGRWQASPDEFPRELLPFGENDGGDYFCINLTTGQIHFFDMEEADPARAHTVIASDLASFLGSMKSFEEFYEDG